MDLQTTFNALGGGILIGVAATALLLFNGRILGVSGVTGGLLCVPNRDTPWRGSFILGLLAGGLVLRLFNPTVFENTSGRGDLTLVVAGVLVGFGTLMGGGCTSGHGICGVSRFSVRSILATLTFILFGFISVALVRLLGEGVS